MTGVEDIKLLKVARQNCIESLLFFTRYFYKQNHNRKFIVSEHHQLICDALEKVLQGEITRLIINIAPRYSKTELAVKNFIAHGLAINSKAKFIHLSYSDTLALDNSEEIRDIVHSPGYQALFPHIQTKRDSKSKKKWYTTDGGGLYATSAAGQVTGFGAGKVDEPNPENEINELFTDLQNKEGFAGAIIIDDPIKPEEALSDVKRKRINDRFDSTIRNRVNSKHTPIIIIQQRVHEKDLTGYLMEVEPEVWTNIKLPCLKDDGTPLWEMKHTREELLHIKKISPYVFECQYQQDPKPVKKGGEFYKLFDYKNNVVKNPIGVSGFPVLYDPNVALHVTFDFNVLPYMSIGIWQVWGKKAIKIDEIAARSPINRTEPACRSFYNRYSTHKSGVFIYGDPSGAKEDTKLTEGQNEFTIILKTLQIFRPSLRKLSKAPSVSARGNFVNALFADGFEGISIFIGDNCVESINDYQYLKEDSDGTKLKELTRDEKSGVSCQKYGHFSDGDDYFICYAFANEYAKHQHGPSNQITMGKTLPSKNTY